MLQAILTGLQVSQFHDYDAESSYIDIFMSAAHFLSLIWSMGQITTPTVQQILHSIGRNILFGPYRLKALFCIQVYENCKGGCSATLKIKFLQC